MKFNIFKLKNLTFENKNLLERKWSERFKYLLIKLVLPRPSTGNCPVKFKKPRVTKKGEKHTPSLKYLCYVTGLINNKTLQEVHYHSDRVKLRKFLQIIIYYLFCLSTVLVLFLGFLVFSDIFYSLWKITETQNPYQTLGLRLAIYSLTSITTIAYTFVIARIALKIGYAVTRAKFADSLCVLNCLFLIIELSQNDILANSRKRKSLQLRINDLAINTSFLQYRFLSKNIKNVSWAKEHFKRMELFIRERENWIIAPIETTLEDLRNDFYNLTRIYLSGNYGEFNWSDVSDSVEIPKLSLRKQLISYLPKFLGIVLPLLLMGYFLKYPQSLPDGIGVNVLTLFFISWLLLAIDATLKLGIVSGIASLAKEIKSLN